MNFEQARFNMVEQQIRPWQVLDKDVLQVLPPIKTWLTPMWPFRWPTVNTWSHRASTPV